MNNKTNKKDAFIRDVTSIELLSKSEVRSRLDEIIQDRVKEIRKEIEEYFKGLIVITEPQKTLKNILNLKSLN